MWVLHVIYFCTASVKQASACACRCAVRRGSLQGRCPASSLSSCRRGAPGHHAVTSTAVLPRLAHTPAGSAGALVPRSNFFGHHSRTCVRPRARPRTHPPPPTPRSAPSPQFGRRRRSPLPTDRRGTRRRHVRGDDATPRRRPCAAARHDSSRIARARRLTRRVFRPPFPPVPRRTGVGGHRQRLFLALGCPSPAGSAEPI